MSDKVRVYEIAEEAGATSAEVITKAKDLNIELKSPQSAVSFEDAEEITKYIMTGKNSKIEVKTEEKPKKVIKKVVKENTEIVKEDSVLNENKIEALENKEAEIEKKPELKKVVISKPIAKPVQSKTQEELDKPAVNPTNANKIVPKRRGLVIIKKKKPKVEEVATKAFNPEIPVIMLSSQDKIEVAINCMHHKAFDYVVKSETAFVRLQKIITSIFKYQKMEKELNWYMDRM